MKSTEITRGILAKLAGCNAETIRYYEKIGIMPSPPRSAAGYRHYDDNHVRRLRFIMQSRDLGFTIDDIQNLLSLVDRRSVTCCEVENVAKTHLLLIQKRINDLKRMESVLTETIRDCSGDNVPECPLIDSLFSETLTTT